MRPELIRGGGYCSAEDDSGSQPVHARRGENRHSSEPRRAVSQSSQLTEGRTHATGPGQITTPVSRTRDNLHARVAALCKATISDTTRRRVMAHVGISRQQSYVADGLQWLAASICRAKGQCKDKASPAQCERRDTATNVPPSRLALYRRATSGP